jgi:hypothetical protein
LKRFFVFYPFRFELNQLKFFEAYLNYACKFVSLKKKDSVFLNFSKFNFQAFVFLLKDSVDDLYFCYQNKNQLILKFIT